MTIFHDHKFNLVPKPSFKGQHEGFEGLNVLTIAKRAIFK
jgi:hypothetical protein